MKDKHTGFQEGDPIKRDMTAKVTEGKSTHEHQKEKKTLFYTDPVKIHITLQHSAFMHFTLTSTLFSDPDVHACIRTYINIHNTLQHTYIIHNTHSYISYSYVNTHETKIYVIKTMPHS
jgi:hypothetical protein